MSGVIFSIIILGIIVFVHELGHFLTAKYYKMPVDEFSIGMGPKLISKKVGETVYSIRILPLGGFVNIGGMKHENVDDYVIENNLQNENEKEENGENEGKSTEKRKISEQELQNIIRNNEIGFYTKKPLARFIVLIAGVVMNFLTALIVLYFSFSLTGNIKPSEYSSVKVESVWEKSNAYNVLKKDDVVVSFNGKKIKTLKDYSKEIIEINTKEQKSTLENQKYDVKILRNGKIVDEKIKLTYNDKIQSYFLGIQLAKEKMNPISKIKYTFLVFIDYMEMNFKGLEMLLTGKVSPREMTGPVGLPKVVGEAYKYAGYLAIVNIFIILSINIGIMNLLPIPALDGGRILFVLPEFFGIKINKKIEERIHLVGIILLLILMVFIFFNDILKYFNI